ncbi:alanine--tRNA ligase [Ferruginibacter albus]|uniref:alanine--tRNA ligase n=1 Tax=Ferruginibacter albus TaxID=2875540 RepID=UPI001CC4B8B8|nr:alanine--tRNA ligase [Ferruginibacter albus]UAY51854.1 alanine--tRNA ligase [Ferruginibacter albus]
MMTSAAIRQQFLDFFKSKGHAIVPSAPIVLKDDPTLLFTNAGMNQFKDYFLGNKKAPNTRIADTQKCLRVSGKHNDLEEVGVDTYHHTMFEMLGNWSFGDYFKKEAIEWSWELLTEVLKLDKSRLYVTVFEGDAKENLPKDEEAWNEWKKWIPEDRILLGNKKDNFWEMGDTGPCGPCTEIHVDCRTDEERKQVDGKTLVNNDHPQVIEIWNNVFIQFNRKKDGSLELLPEKHVDTGMGFERLVRVLQQKQSNYDTDVFTGTIAAIETITNKKYDYSDSKQAIAFRVLADHIRAISFTIADGQLPSNTGAGYVIRRILRRAVRYYYSYLDYKQPLLFQILPVIAKQFENVFPELIKQQDFVGKVIKEEEEAFLRTLDKGLKLIQEVIEASKASKIIDGKSAFKLHDTYGFPIDLTKLIATENGLGVDEIGYEEERKGQQEGGRSASALDTEDWIIINEGSESKFIGYDSLETKTKILRYRKIKAKGKESYQLVLAETPFYAESGGQVGDSGQLIINNSPLIINDTKKENNLFIHFADAVPAELSGEVIAKVDVDRRKAITVHHSVTHLLHAALRKVLGTHVAQKGSLVNEEHLRFDFSHFAKMADEEIIAVEKIVNEKIRENIPVVIKQLPKEEALKLGAMALFGEKYGDVVRVVIIDPAYSVELCGGTHVGNTGELGLFKIKHESAVAAGVRRVEAVCGKAAEEYIDAAFGVLNTIKETLKNPKELSKAIENLQSENAELKKRIENLEARQLVGIRNELLQKDEIINNVTFIGSIIEVPNADALKKLCFDLKNHIHDHVAVLCSNIDGKPFVAVGISDVVVAAKNLDAGKIIKEHIAPLIKGGGGGQKNLATAGGQDTSNLKAVIEKVKSLL